MDNANNNKRTFLDRMDNQNWFRMLVCLLPGLILAKLSSYSGAPQFLSIIGSLGMLAGFAAYFLWGRLRKSMNTENENEQADVVAQDEENTAEVTLPPAAEHLYMLSEMREYCNGDYEQVIKLLQTEAELYPEAPLLAVIEEAHRRKSREVKIRSGS